MTYVRTKDGLWVYNEKEKCAERPNKEMGCTQVWLNFKKEYIIKQADTIEELCDEFVVIVDGKHYIRVPAGNPNFQTYGAIWTDKGLIYVAKMNDKGELELL